MNVAILKKPSFLIGLAVLLVLATVGAAVAIKWDAQDDHVTGAQRDRVAKVAEGAVPDGTVIKVERDDDDDTDQAYEVKVKAADGTIHEVTLDKDLRVIGTLPDDDSLPWTPDQRAALEASIAKTLPGGVVVEVEHTNDHGATYEAQVQVINGQVVKEYDVYLDEAFNVLFKKRD